MEAARVLVSVPEEVMSYKDRADFQTALAGFRKLQLSLSDTPEADLNIGVMHEDLGKTDLAESSYKTAIRLESECFFSARVNLANLYNRLKRKKKLKMSFMRRFIFP